MEALLVTGDFVGELLIAASNSLPFNPICQETQEVILRQILGDDIWKKFDDDLSSATPPIPQTEPYKSLYNGCYYKVKNSSGNYVDKYQIGIKKMLKYFVYFDYVNIQTITDTNKGAAMFQDENGLVLSKEDLLGFLERKYNKAVTLSKEVTEFIKIMNESVEITEINGNVLSTPDTRFLQVGQTITVNSVETQIADIDTNVSITVITTVSGNSWLKEYFEDWVENKFRPRFAGGFF